MGYAKAKKSVERVAANQMDYEALAKRMEKKTKQKMVIVKEDCDSFEIMPLNIAEEQGKCAKLRIITEYNKNNDERNRLSTKGCPK